MPAAQVLDSYALVAFFRGEPVAADVRDLLTEASACGRSLQMTEVSYAEAKYIILRKDGPDAWQRAAVVLESLPIEFHPATRSLADAAAEFKARHRLSLADAFAAALAGETKGELVTGDPEFEALKKEVRIRWLREGR
jgi:ribonuclease VapC